MQLISRDGFIADGWRRFDEDAVDGPDVPAEGDVILAHHRLTALTSGHERVGKTGLHIENDASVQSLHNVLSRLDLISIDFPSRADGRGFSLARRLRGMGFKGELRARGPLIVDQFAFALSCGFDTVEIPMDLAERQPEAQWLKALDAIEPGFQLGFSSGIEVLSRRHAASL